MASNIREAEDDPLEMENENGERYRNKRFETLNIQDVKKYTTASYWPDMPDWPDIPEWSDIPELSDILELPGLPDWPDIPM